MKPDSIKEKIAQEICLQNWEDSDFKAWNICHAAFDKVFKKGKPISDDDMEYLCVHLTAYLACWGMYRNNSCFAGRNCMVHKDAVKTLVEYYHLNELSFCDLKDENKRKDILALFNKLQEIYKNGKTPGTDTRVTKVMLGTLACMPGYDTNVTGFLKNRGINDKVNDDSLKALAESDIWDEILNSELYSELKDDGEPDMKILDTYMFAYEKSVL